MAILQSLEPSGLNLLTATIGDLEKALVDGATTSQQIVSRYLDQIASYNGYLHAVISTAPREHVLELARSLDQERAEGNIRSPLHGVPVILKVWSNSWCSLPCALVSYTSDLQVSKMRSLQEVMEFMKDHAELEFPPESPNMKRLEEAASDTTSDDDRHTAIKVMRDWGRKRGIDKCLEENGINAILCRADSEISHWYAAAGYPMASLPLSYSSFNKRPFGVCALASQYQEGILIQLMSAWEEVFNKERVLPTWLGGDPGLGCVV